MRSFLKIIVYKIRGFLFPPSVVWQEGFNTWREAEAKASSYSDSVIFEKVLTSSRLVKKGLAHHERDSVLFFSPSYNFALICLLQEASRHLKEPLFICDFGGALGSLYWQHRQLLVSLNLTIRRWLIIEQPRFVELGLSEFKDGTLDFASSFPEGNVDVLILSSVLQYLENPWEVLKSLLSQKPHYVFLDRTGFTLDDSEVITLQKVREPIYHASYPCWFLSRKNLLETMVRAGYQLVTEFEALDRSNVPSLYRGVVWKRKKD